MKNILVLTLLTLQMTISHAQKNWLSLTISEYSQFDFREVVSDTLSDTYRGGITFRPALGYYRLIGDSWGLGCEIGYRKSDFDYSSFWNESASVRTNHTNNSAIKALYFAPSVFEQFKWKSYILTTSVGVPVEYIGKHNTVDHYESVNRTTGETLRTSGVTYSFPRQIRIGVYGNIGVQRKVIRQLYCGLQLGIGFYGTTVFGNIYQINEQTSSGVVISDKFEIENKKNFESKFDFRPAFSISYYF